MLYPGDAAAAVCSGRAVSLVVASAGYPPTVPAPAAAAAAAAAYGYTRTQTHSEWQHTVNDMAEQWRDDTTYNTRRQHKKVQNIKEMNLGAKEMR